MLYVNPEANAAFRDRALSPGGAAREEQALKEYEQLFLFEMLKEMRRTIPDTGLLGAGSKKAWFDEMMDDYLAGEMAKSDQLGIADQMKQQLDAMAAQRTHGIVGDGIKIRPEVAGIGVHPKNADYMAIRAMPAGIAVDLGPGAGIPLERAHASYRLNQ